jgi:hypothetical protein
MVISLYHAILHLPMHSLQCETGLLRSWRFKDCLDVCIIWSMWATQSTVVLVACGAHDTAFGIRHSLAIILSYFEG